MALAIALEAMLVLAEGWFHGAWTVTNRPLFEIEVIEVVATFPESLEIVELEPGCGGPIKLMKAVNRRKILKVNQIMSPYKSPDKSGAGGANFLYRISRTPESDRGRSIRLQIHFRELDNPNRKNLVRCEAIVPWQPEIPPLI
jgi:hypothetical protein